MANPLLVLLRIAILLATSPRSPRFVRSGVTAAGAALIRQRIARQDRRQARAARPPAPTAADDPRAYLIDAYHGGVTFWDWIGLPDGGLWYLYNWPVVGRTVMERILCYPQLRAVLELDGHAYEDMARRMPEAVDQMREALATGRLEIANGTYGQPLAQTVGGESLLRHFYYGLAAVEDALGVRVDSYLAQEPQFFAQLPQVLAGFGYRGALLRTHWAPFGTDPAADAAVVRWRGPDGSELLTVPRYTFMAYDYLEPEHEDIPHGGITGLVVHSWDSDRVQAFMQEARAHGVVHPLISRVADLKQPESPLPDAVARAARGELHFVTFREYLDLPHQEAPTVTYGPDDIPSTIPWGLGGDRLQRETARAEAAALTAERLDALAFVLGRPSEEARLEEAWKWLLIAQHHDLHVCGPSTSLRHGRATFDVGCDMARGCRQLADETAGRALDYLAAQVDTSWVQGTPVAIFNPNPWRRVDYVEMAARGDDFRLLDETGRPLPFQTLAHHDGQATLGFVVEVPGLGYRLLDLQRIDGSQPAAPDPAAGETGTFANAFYAAEVDGGGSLHVEAQGQDLLAAGAYLTVWKDAAWHDSRDASRATLTHDGPVFRRYLVEGNLAAMPFRQWITMYRDLPRIDVRLDLDFGEGSLFGPSGPGSGSDAPYYLQDDRKLCVNLESQLSRCVYDSPFLLAEAEGPRLNALGWAGLERGDGQGMAYLHRGTLGCHLDREAGVLRNVLAWAPARWLYASADFVRGRPSLHTILRGRHTYEYALTPYASPGQAARRAADYRLPLTLTLGDRSPGVLPSRGSFLEVEPEEVLLSALFVQKGALYARLWNASPEPQEATLRSGAELRLHATRLDLTGKVPIERTALRPWGIHTLQLEGLGTVAAP